MSKNVNRYVNQARGGSDRRDAKSRGVRPKRQGCQSDVVGTPYRDQDKMNKGNSSRNARRGMEIANSGAAMSRDNPVSFYTKFDQFVSDAAKLPFALPLGAATTQKMNPMAADDATDVYYAPGVMGIYFVPSIGVSNDYTSPINRSSIRFYTYLRSNQKASASYDHQDVTMMLIALDSAYMYHAFLSRVYATVNQFTPVNEYYSRAIMKACCVDFDDLRAHMQDFRAYINAFAYSLGQYALPAGITLFDRHRWMCEGLYTDSTSTRAQTYIFVPRGYWEYDNTVSTGSQCTYAPYATAPGMSSQNLYTYEELRMLGDEMLNKISNEEDFAVISGDIYNFYGGETYKLPYIDENYAVLPAYSEVVLSQIENLTIAALDPSSLKITQDPSVNGGAVLFQPTVSTAGFGMPVQLNINFHHDSPSSDDVIEATRLMCAGHYKTGSTSKFVLDTCGTEIVAGITIFGKKDGTINGVANFPANLLMNGVVSTDVMLTSVTALQQFDWAPQVQIWKRSGSAAPYTYTLQGTTWDVDNYNTIPTDYLTNINLGCLLSLFNVGVNRE